METKDMLNQQETGEDMTGALDTKQNYVSVDAENIRSSVRSGVTRTAGDIFRVDPKSGRVEYGYQTNA